MNENSKNGVNKQVFHWDLRLPKLVEADPRGQDGQFGFSKFSSGIKQAISLTIKYDDVKG